MPPYNELRRLLPLLVPDTKSQNWDAAEWDGCWATKKQLRQNAKSQRALITAS